MRIDIINVITDFVRQAALDLDTRLDYQAEALRETICTDPVMGQWLDSIGIEYLTSAFSMQDRDFVEFFPGMAHLSRQERLGLLETFESHLEKCSHCSLKRGYDLESNARIEKGCRENKDFLLRLLHEDEGGTAEEIDHPLQVELISAHL
jgi:hypothetical protein